jgi:trk system potassium uptake protein TrkA
MRILIVGAGNVGSTLAKLLAVKGNEVIVVDKSEERVKKLAEEADVLGMARDATDPELYEELDLSSLDVVVSVTDKDEINLFVSTIARDYGVPRIITRVKNPSIARLLERIGVEYALTEPYVIAKLIESTIEGKYHVVELVPVFTGNYHLVTITITETDSSVGKPLSAVDLPEEGVKLLAVIGDEGFMDPEEMSDLRPGMQIIGLVRKDMIERFVEAFR